MHIVQTDAAVDGKVVNTLLTLLNKCVSEEFPSQILGFAIHLFHGLIHRHSAHWHRAVAHNPFARLVNVVARRKVHKGIATPFAAPYGLFNLLLNATGGGRIADVGVYLDQKVGANNHWFSFRVIDVGRQHSTTCCNLLSHKLWRYVSLYAQLGAVHILAYGHILHLGGYDALLGIVHLAHLFTLLSTQWQLDMLKAQMIQTLVGQPHTAILRRQFGQLLHTATFHYPWLAQSGQTLAEVDYRIVVAIGTTGVID